MAVEDELRGSHKDEINRNPSFVKAAAVGRVGF
jgi:hypothetical protein